MKKEKDNPNNDSDNEALTEQGMWLENDKIVVLLEAVTTFLDVQWSEQHQSYGATDSEERYGHPFETLLRLKSLVNDIRYQLEGGFGSVGCCSRCKGNDGSYTYYENWWGYCRLCEVRWLIDNVRIDERIAPLLVSPWVENMQANYHQVPLYVPNENAA